MLRIIDAPPEQGEEFEAIAADFQKLILPGITHWQHGQFFAYFPAISTFESMLGELYAASVSNPGFNVSDVYLYTNFSGFAPRRVRSLNRSSWTGWLGCSASMRNSLLGLRSEGVSS
jgi:hypothetical protein